MALAQVVDRRVRHLRKPLPEVGEERPRAPGERRQRRVVAHRRRRLVSSRSGGTKQQRQLLTRVAGARLASRELLGRRLDRLAAVEWCASLAQPAAVRQSADEATLDVCVLLDAESRGVDDEQLAGPEATSPHPCVGGERDRAGFGGACD